MKTSYSFHVIFTLRRTFYEKKYFTESLIFYLTQICTEWEYALLEDLEETLKDFYCSDKISNHIQKSEYFFF